MFARWDQAWFMKDLETATLAMLRMDREEAEKRKAKKKLAKPG
jgi:hypothetical protein